MDCCICYEVIKQDGFLCYKCCDGNICDLCYYGKYLNLFELYVEGNEMFKNVSCPVCRSTYKEQYVEN